MPSSDYVAFGDTRKAFKLVSSFDLRVLLLHQEANNEQLLYDPGPVPSAGNLSNSCLLVCPSEQQFAHLIFVFAIFRCFRLPLNYFGTLIF